MTIRPTSVQVEVVHGAPVSLGEATIESGSIVSMDGLSEGLDYSVNYPASTVTFTDRVHLLIASFSLRADLLDPPPPPDPPDFGTEVPEDVAYQLATRVTQARAFLDNPTPTNAAVVTALKLTIRVVLWLAARQIGRA